MAQVFSKEVFSFFDNFSKNYILLFNPTIEILKKGNIFMAHNIRNYDFWIVIGYGILDEQLSEVVEQLHENWAFDVEKEGIYEVKLLIYFDEDGFEIRDTATKFLDEIDSYRKVFLNNNDDCHFA